MNITTKAIIINCQNHQDSDKNLTLLTENQGVIFAKAKGAQKPKSKFTANSEFLTYSIFQLYKNNNGYFIDTAETIESFFAIRGDLRNLSLASYFAQLIYIVMKTKENSKVILRLLLNSLSYLQSQKKSREAIKSIFQLRLMCLSGFAPLLSGCVCCDKTTEGQINFSAKNGNIKCTGCIAPNEENTYKKVPNNIFAAMNHITYCQFERLFSFEMSEKALIELDKITEEYVQNQLGVKIPTLEFYHGIE